MTRLTSNYPTLRQILSVIPDDEIIITQVAYVDGKYYSFRTAWHLKDGDPKTMDDSDEILDLPVVQILHDREDDVYLIDIRQDLPVSYTNKD